VCADSFLTADRGVIVTDFLKTKRDEIQARLAELAPLVEEHRQLEAAAQALAALPATTSRPSRSTRAPQAARARRPRARRTSTRGRPRGSGTRALQTLEIIKTSPGITIAEIATAMGIKQNYLYRVLPSLQKDGKITKRDRGWHAAESPVLDAAAN